jgi:hypothetical protein
LTTDFALCVTMYAPFLNSHEVRTDSITQVNKWCRKLYKRKGQIRPLDELDDLELKKALKSRIQMYDDIKLYQLLEVIAWSHMEWSIFSAWFPGMGKDERDRMEEIEACVRAGGMYYSAYTQKHYL